LSEVEAASDSRTKVKMQIFVSTVVLAAALVVILSKSYGEADTKWAAGIVGVVIGYWLR
jgi:hypothetical protein